MLSGTGLCDGLINRPEESYRLWCVVVCYLETSSRMRRPWPALGCNAIGGGGERDKNDETRDICIFTKLIFVVVEANQCLFILTSVSVQKLETGIHT